MSLYFIDDIPIYSVQFQYLVASLCSHSIPSLQPYPHSQVECLHYSIVIINNPYSCGPNGHHYHSNGQRGQSTGISAV